MLIKKIYLSKVLLRVVLYMEYEYIDLTWLLLCGCLVHHFCSFISHISFLAVFPVQVLTSWLITFSFAGPNNEDSGASQYS